jgi:hypothetical protein
MTSAAALASPVDGAFSYRMFSDRNIGFVSAAEQTVLQRSTVFIAGTGGMGGACVLALVRAGVGELILADIDVFEVSNLNRQVFAFTDNLGRPKAVATADACRKINPDVNVEVLGEEWPGKLAQIARRARVFVNGTDDLVAGIHMYRVARVEGASVIDAYASPLPSVMVARPADPRLEERLRYPTIGKPCSAITAQDRQAAFLREAEYVLIHSSSRHHIDLGIAAEVALGNRARMSFAPMVITTGALMAYETLAVLLGRHTGTDYRGWFFNPYKPAIERPLPAALASIWSPIVRHRLNQLKSQASGMTRTRRALVPADPPPSPNHLQQRNDHAFT